MQYIAWAIAFFIAGTAFSAVIKVPQDYPEIEHAVAAAEDGDTILIAPGIHTYGVIQFEDKSLVFTSTNPDDPGTVGDTVLDGGGSAWIIARGFADNKTELSFRGLVFQNTGMLLRIELMDFEFIDCFFRDCSRGLVDAETYSILSPSSARFVRCHMTGIDSETFVPIFIERYSKIEFDSCEIIGNPSPANMINVIGSSSAGCSVTFRDCQYLDNQGGAIHSDGFDVTVERCNFSRNEGHNIINGFWGKLECRDSIFLSNHVRSAGAIEWYSFGPDNDMQIERCRFIDNQATQSYGPVAGALVLSGEGSVSACTFSGNSSFGVPGDISGGAVAVESRRFGNGLVPLLKFSDCIFRANRILGVGDENLSAGAGVFRNVGVQDCDFEGNRSHWAGGAVFDQTAVLNCRFTENQGARSILNLRSRGSLTNCLIADNITTAENGTVVRTSTVPGNPVPTPLINCTIAGNSCDATGASIHGEASLWLHNSIVWGNTPNAIDIPELTTPPSVFEHCLVQDGVPDHSGAFVSAPIDEDPLFVDADAGDYRLSPGSPAIDSGARAALLGEIETDLDAAPRFHDDPGSENIEPAEINDTGVGHVDHLPLGTNPEPAPSVRVPHYTTPPDFVPGIGETRAIDRGAYEFQGQTTLCAGDCDRSGTVDFDDLVSILLRLGDETAGDCDADWSGKIDFGDLAAALSRAGACP